MSDTQHHNDDTELQEKLTGFGYHSLIGDSIDDLVELFHQHAHKYTEEIIGEDSPTNKFTVKRDAQGTEYTDVKGQHAARAQNMLRREQRQRNNERKGRAS